MIRDGVSAEGILYHPTLWTFSSKIDLCPASVILHMRNITTDLKTRVKKAITTRVKKFLPISFEFIRFSMISVVDEVPLLKLFNHRQMWRTEVIIYCLMVTGLSLSLPEIMSSAVSSVVGLASHACVIPVLFARESIFTSTHLHAIVLISKYFKNVELHPGLIFTQGISFSSFILLG